MVETNLNNTKGDLLDDVDQLHYQYSAQVSDNKSPEVPQRQVFNASWATAKNVSIMRSEFVA